jgi:hypothetical protein
VIVDKKSEQIICTNFANGKHHDFRLFKESTIHLKPETRLDTDTGYQGIGKLRSNSVPSRKKSKKKPLTKEDKAFNHTISSERVLNEHVIGRIKRFHIVSDKYRNRRKRFGLRFNLISAITNMNLIS